MTPRIVLHVGAPKTGSTYLQLRLRAGAIRLRAQGIYVPVLPAMGMIAGNAKLLATALSGEPSRSFRRAFPDIDVALVDPAKVLEDLLHDWRPQQESVILSAENFRPRHAPIMRDILPPGVRCSVVLFVRRQDDWAESYFNQLVKTRDIDGGLDCFLRAVCDPVGDRLCHPDWESHYQAWRSALGSCSVVFYDGARSDIFASFVEAAGLEAPVDLIDIERVQVSLDLHQLVYLTQLDRSMSFTEFLGRRNASAQAAACLPAAPAGSIISNDQRSSLRARFEASNRRLLSELGLSKEQALLSLEAAPSPVFDLAEIATSAAYAAHRALAEQIFCAADQEGVTTQHDRNRA